MSGLTNGRNASSSSSAQASSGGVGVVGLLGVAFVVLKLVGVITWPWIWVLAPFWMVAALCLLVMVLAVLLAVVLR